MQTSALLVLPSRAESLGMVLVEALACGTPVVATRCGGPEDIVVDGVGELVEPDNPSELAAAIARVLDASGSFDPQRLRDYALGHFGIDAVVDQLVVLYNATVREGESPTRVQTATASDASR
jgi:glycosyltransferase involved in cell wall biosynthesis